MFHANIRAMEGVAEALQAQLGKMNQAIEDAEMVGRELTRMEGMEQRVLFRETEALREERERLSVLSAVLCQAALYYGNCEKEIMNAAIGSRPSAVPSVQAGLPAVSAVPSVQAGLSAVSASLSVQAGLSSASAVPSVQAGLSAASASPPAQAGLPAASAVPSVQGRSLAAALPVREKSSAARPGGEPEVRPAWGFGLLNNIWERRKQRRKDGHDGRHNRD